jgi:hypothetical protein
MGYRVWGAGFKHSHFVHNIEKISEKSKGFLEEGQILWLN